MIKKIKAWLQTCKCRKGQHVYPTNCYVKGRVREGNKRRVRYWLECAHCGKETEPLNKKQLIKLGVEKGWLDYEE